MISTGVILLLLGWLLGIGLLTTAGSVLLIVGVILAILGSTGRAIGGRSHWY